MNTTTTTTLEKPELTLDQMPPVPAGAKFHLREIKTVCLPHPYCITPRHVAVAADYHSGMLDADAIRHAEKLGAQCDICKNKWRDGSGGQVLPYDKHETLRSLFIVIPKGISDLNKIEGLHAYLFDNKPAFAALGIQGFAFPSE